MSHHFHEHSSEGSNSLGGEEDFSSEHDEASFSGDHIIGSSIDHESSEQFEEASGSSEGSSEDIIGHHEKGCEQSCEQSCEQPCQKKCCEHKKKHIKRKNKG